MSLFFAVSLRRGAGQGGKPSLLSAPGYASDRGARAMPQAGWLGQDQMQGLQQGQQVNDEPQLSSLLC